jgi:hypothetical protein
MKISEVRFRAGWPIERLYIGRELDEVSGCKPSGDAKLPEDLNE